MKNPLSYHFFLLTGLVFLFFSPAAVFGQEKCGVPAYMEMLRQQHPGMEQDEAFEAWIAKKKNQSRKAADPRAKEEQIVYELPVVIHVIHNGERLGQGSNIPQSQIDSQLQTLNIDFRLRNERQLNELPPAFRQVAGDARVEFVLASQDPEGLPTSGITRTRGDRTSYSLDTDMELKSLIHWPPEDYLNLYVAVLSGSVIGYAQYPESDRLLGLEEFLAVSQTDGVVIDYRHFGEGGNALSTSSGRTATHEVGHFLGLRHIWGDGGCNRHDFVEDTPDADRATTGCPTNEPSSCGSPNMYQNYMDYTSDRCMSLFTQGQVERMEVVLQHSPRRHSLLQSRAKEEPTIVANDAGIRTFSLDLTDPCSKDFIPRMEVRNYGSNQLNSVEIGLFINNSLQFQQTFSMDLDYLESAYIAFPEQVLNLQGRVMAEVRILQTNQGEDQKAFNNSRSAELYVPAERQTPYLQDFENGIFPFYRINKDYNLTWELAQAPITGGPNNLGVVMNYYEYSVNIGSKDLLISPVFDLSDEEMAFLSFRVAYALYARGDNDRLEVYVSTDCAENLETATRIFNKSGSNLATAPSTREPFVPEANRDWRNELLDLSDFVGQENVQLIFVGTNDFGNNLYLDDIEVFTEPRNQLDIALQQIRYPAAVSCEDNPVPAIIIRNRGQETIQRLEITYSLNDEPEQVLQLSRLDLASQESQQINLPALELSEGQHVLSVELASPNDAFDQNPSNNRGSKQFVIDAEQDLIPLRQRFKTASLEATNWVSSSTDPDYPGWLLRSVADNNGGNGYAAVSEFFEEEQGFENWLVSPILDLSESPLAGLQFSYSYASTAQANDQFQVRVSVDCGQSWPYLLFERSGRELSQQVVDSRWVPRSIADWQGAFVNLSDFVGNSQVRVALIATSDGGNNLYVDNLEFFEADEPITVAIPEENSMTAFPNPTNANLNLIFNLKQREDVLVQLYDIMGKMVFESLQPNTLNQVYAIDTHIYRPGMYVLRARSLSLDKTERIIIAR